MCGEIYGRTCWYRMDGHVTIPYVLVVSQHRACILATWRVLLHDGIMAQLALDTAKIPAKRARSSYGEAQSQSSKELKSMVIIEAEKMPA